MRRRTAASLITTGYAMFFGGLLMLGARLGDRFGHRRIILTGLAVFAVAAVAGCDGDIGSGADGGHDACKVRLRRCRCRRRCGC